MAAFKATKYNSFIIIFLYCLYIFTIMHKLQLEIFQLPCDVFILVSVMSPACSLMAKQCSFVGQNKPSHKTEMLYSAIYVQL